jgi:predicted TIM-barrel fold metal-dependent hydrolase
MVKPFDIIDCHVHICPDQIAARNKEIIQNSSGITPAYDGSIRQLDVMMEKAGITISVVNNIVTKVDLMSKANDFTAKVVSHNKERFVGMGVIIPGEARSVGEVQRCKEVLKFKALKMHNSHSKVLPSDPRNDKIYEKIIAMNMSVLFHCGLNPYSSSDAIQYSDPKNFISVMKSYPRMKAVFGHAAGFQDFPEYAVELLSLSGDAVADTALDVERNGNDLHTLLRRIQTTKFLFGSDYPIHDGTGILSWLMGELLPEDFQMVCSSNPRKFFLSSG